MIKLVKQEYEAAFQFMKQQLIKPIFITVLLFAAIMILSYAVLYEQDDILMELMQHINDSFVSKGVFHAAESLQSFDLSATSLISNNMTACLMAVLLGLIPFFYVPVVTIAVNALIIGAMAAMMLSMGLPMNFFVFGIIPHGIFELPALFLSVSLGLYVCRQENRMIKEKQQNISFMELLLPVVRIYVLIVIPMLITAGCIEAYITPHVMNIAISGGLL